MTSVTSLFHEAIGHHGRGQLDDAEALYATILQVEPDHVSALYLLGLVAHQRGHHGDAVALIMRAIELAPSVAAHHNTLGDALRLLGRLPEAELALRRALQLDPSSDDVRSNLALVLHLQQRWSESLTLMIDLIALPPRAMRGGDVQSEVEMNDDAYVRFRELIVQSLQHVSRGASTTNDERTRAVLLRLCDDDAISTQRLADALLDPVVMSPWFATLEQCVTEQRDPCDAVPEAVHTLLSHPLLLGALPRLVVAREALERVLTSVRQSLLRRHVSSAPDATAHEPTFPFLCALAQQSFANEYAYLLTSAERQSLGTLRETVEDSLAAWTGHGAAAHQLETLLALLACYVPLSDVRHVVRLVGTDAWSAPLRRVIQQQVVDVLRERLLAESLPAMTPISDNVSKVVRDMYEENPYPRWLSAERPAPIEPFAFVRQLQVGNAGAHHGHTDTTNDTTTTSRERAEILVAGCGTGRQPLQIAMQFAPSRVLAIDLSRTSLGYAQRMAEKLDVSNVTFAQADLLELRLPDRSFDIISCSGVLHHLADPIAGWRVLLRHLAPGGVMKIGLYATKARRSVDAARAFVTRHRYSASADDIRNCRRAILDQAPTDDARRVVSFLDFFSISGCRDLFMHVQERSYTALELADTLRELELRFLGFQLDAAALSSFQAANPDPASLIDLTSWDRFEASNPDTFAGMYQFWCARA